MAKERKHYRRGRRSKNRGFASWSLGKKIGTILGGTFALVAATGVVILASKISKIDMTTLDPTELNVTVDEEKEARPRGTGYLNVALFGVDSRESELGVGTRSDTIMIASLNRETLEVKVSSVFRDTFLEQDDGSLDKANAAYSYGGPEDAIAMLNKNLDMDIEHYVTVNFEALIDVIDAVGGIEIEVEEEETPFICGYILEMHKATGRVSVGVTEPGLQLLNGMQATAYARIRYTAGDDFKRAERQRLVLSKIVEKLQNADVVQLNKIIDAVFPEVSTNFTLAEILDYAKDAFDYKLGEMTGFPFDKTTDKMANIGDVVIPVTLESNVEQLHAFFFGDEENYSVSSRVSEISAKIVNKSGVRDADVDETTQGVMSGDDDEDDDGGYGSHGGNYGGGGSSGNSGSSGNGGSSGGGGSSGNSGSSGNGGSSGSSGGNNSGTGGGTSGGDNSGSSGGNSGGDSGGDNSGSTGGDSGGDSGGGDNSGSTGGEGGSIE